MPKLWKLKPEIPQEIDEKLSAYPKLLRQLLYNRGLTDANQIADFLNPQYPNLHSPFLFKDMQKAVDRIWQAIGKKEKICVYGDYDADAVTANAVLQGAFSYLGANAESYIPDRFAEGYGVNLEALEKIRDGGAKLIITVDCGTNSIDAAQWCKENRIDFIITDHHEIIGAVPDALALINPKNPSDNYPYSEITGVGVAFKLASALLNDPRSKIQDPNRIDGYEKWLLDLVAIGTVADCHTLVGENRILVKYGLKVLAKTKWVGLKALMQSAGLYGEQGLLTRALDTYTLGFVIAPRLNAAGRLEHADIALNLLMENNPQAAGIKSAELELINQRRQKLTQGVLSEANEKVILIKERKVLALVGEGWPKGVMGLVAGRLAEEHYKPVIVLERTEKMCTGSARTAGEFNLIEALKFSSEHLLKFGGHKQAAGLSLDIGQFDLFYQKLLEYAEQNINPEKLEKTLELEAELGEPDLQLTTYNLVTSLEPFGVGNQKPKFLLKNLELLSSKAVGKEGSHLQMKLKMGKREISGIFFSANEAAKNLQSGSTIDVAAELIEDNWNGNKIMKLRVVDVRNSNILSS